MEMLTVQNGQIVTPSGQPIRLRGFNIGGWLNMEDFINGYVGAEHNLRSNMARILGKEKAQFFFDRFLDYFFTEDDVAYMEDLGANVLRLPFNYRHFERDDHPFEYLEEGFRRMDQAVEWCFKHHIYVILDFHAVQGWHNPDWHSDNAHVHILLYNQKHFQERAVALWREIALRYRGNPAVAGYDLMNEPVTRLEYERYDPSFYNWDALNDLYRQMAKAIREVDPDHLLFIEGDNFATQYDGLDGSFDPKLVVSTHNYTTPTVSPGDYPGTFHDMYWNRDILAAEFGMHSGTRLAFEQHKPIFAGEFGVWYSGHLDQIEQRVCALDDQLGVFDSAGVHWAIWTFKDIGAMGAVNIAPDSEYLQRIAPILKAKHLAADGEGATIGKKLKEMGDTIDQALSELGIPFPIERQRFAQFSLFGYLAQFLQVPYAHLFKDCSETDLDRMLSAFAFKNCIPNQPVVDVLTKHFTV
jgi:aryl-phospho-beta-D-glucosidase BglC (GH1 family)